jgi:hypothetical protein
MTMYNSNTTPPPPPLLAAPKIFLCCRIISVTLLFVFPFCFFYAPAKGNNALTYGMAFWDAMLHISVVPLIFLTVFIGLLFVVDDKHSASIDYHYNPVASIKECSISSHSITTAMVVCQTMLSRLLPRAEMGVLGIVLAITVAQSVQSQLQVVHPGWIWNPALWMPGAYRVYSPGNIQKALKNICLEGNVQNNSTIKNDPLCLSRAEWNELRYHVVLLKKGNSNSTETRGLITFHLSFLFRALSLITQH